jgi:hypothetical protein
VGYNATAIPNTTSELDVTGAGTLSIGTSSTPTNANFQIGNGATSNVGNAGILDLNGLANFYANLGTGLFRVGSPTNAGSANGGGSTVILATNSTIQAATMLLGGPDGSANGGATAVQSLKLGSGTNVINLDTLNLGGLGTADGRSNGSITFNGATGTLKMRSQTDPINGRTTLNMGVRVMDTGVAALAHLFDTTAHSADLLFGTMTIGSRSTTGTFTGGVTAEFRFDSGTLNANDLIVGSRGGTTAAASTGTGIVSLGGGSATLLPEPPRPQVTLQFAVYFKYQLIPAASAKPELPRTITVPGALSSSKTSLPLAPAGITVSVNEATYCGPSTREIRPCTLATGACSPLFTSCRAAERSTRAAARPSRGRAAGCHC